jgi:hypothetical protein
MVNLKVKLLMADDHVYYRQCINRNNSSSFVWFVTVNSFVDALFSCYANDIYMYIYTHTYIYYLSIRVYVYTL